MRNVNIFLIVGAVIFVLIAAGVLWCSNSDIGCLNFEEGKAEDTLQLSAEDEAMSDASALPVAQGKFSQKPGVEAHYINDAPLFSFELPDGFTAEEYGTNAPSVKAVVAYNQNRNGLLIFIVPSNETALTENSIRNDQPRFTFRDVESAALPEGTAAISFQSDNPLWNGAARELWFLHGGFRYELSTARADAELLEFVRSSWRWR